MAGGIDGVQVWKYGQTLVAWGATWDFNPNRTRDDYADAFIKNAVHAERDFGANPPQSVQSALHDKTLIERMFNPDRKSPVDDEGGFHEWFVPDLRHEYFMHIDMSMATDSTGMGMCHYDLETDTIVVDLIHTIVKTVDWKLSFERIFHMIVALKKMGFKFAKVTFDSWQSFSTIERLVNADIPAGTYSVDRGTEAYDTLIETLLMGKLDYYFQQTFVTEMKELKLYKGNKYDHPPLGSKDTSDGVAGCVSQCMMARIGLSVSTGEVESAIHMVHPLAIDTFRTVEGGSYFVLNEVIIEAHERARKRVVRIDAAGDYLIFVMGWNDKLNQQLFVDEYLIWEDYTNSTTQQYFETFVNSLLKLYSIETFSLNANVPIEIINFLRGTGRRISSPLANRSAGRAANRVATTGVVSGPVIRMMISQLKKGNLSIPRTVPLIKDLKFMTDDNQRERKFVSALAGWTDFASREISFGRTGQSMPRSIAANAAPLNPSVRQAHNVKPSQASGAVDMDQVRAKFAHSLNKPNKPQPDNKPPGQKRLPRSRKLR